MRLLGVFPYMQKDPKVEDYEFVFDQAIRDGKFNQIKNVQDIMLAYLNGDLDVTKPFDIYKLDEKISKEKNECK